VPGAILTRHQTNYPFGESRSRLKRCRNRTFRFLFKTEEKQTDEQRKDSFQWILSFYCEWPLSRLRPNPLPADVLESFATIIARLLREMKQDNARAVWQRWLLEYLEQRFLGQPKSWPPGEVQQVPFWLLHVGALFPDGVTLFKDLPHRKGIHAEWVLSDMEEHMDIFNYADACAELILAIADAISTPLADPGKLLGIIKRMKSAGVSQELGKALDEFKLRLGIND
jgi:hypothetical protein